MTHNPFEDEILLETQVEDVLVQLIGVVDDCLGKKLTATDQLEFAAGLTPGIARAIETALLAGAEGFNGKLGRAKAVTALRGDALVRAISEDPTP